MGEGVPSPLRAIVLTMALKIVIVKGMSLEKAFDAAL